MSDSTGSTSNPQPDAAALEREVRALRAEVARLRAGEEPVSPHAALETGGHLLWVLGHTAAEIRQKLAAGVVHMMGTADRCHMEQHVFRISEYKHQAETYRRAMEHAREEAARLERVSGAEGRAVALSMAYALLPEATGR
ncbi:hypothetical protein ACWDZ4_20180 [Streptomyces sp. NPDC003016]